MEIIAGYSIGFNQHGEVAGDYAANVRMFEVMLAPVRLYWSPIIKKISIHCLNLIPRYSPITAKRSVLKKLQLGQ